MKNTVKTNDATTVSFETFKKLNFFDTNNIYQREPSCFNGMVRFKKYRVTIEPIEESDEVYAARLQELWDNSDNHHDSQPLEKAAASIGYEFTTKRGSKINTKNLTNNDNTAE